MTIIGIAGSTGSGKSTLTNAIRQKFGDKITVIEKLEKMKGKGKEEGAE